MFKTLLTLLFFGIIVFQSGCGLIATGIGYAVYDKIGTEKSVSSPPEILTNDLPAGVQNLFYEHTIRTNEECTLSIISGSLPSGIVLHNQLGMILGTPLEDGVFNFDIQASNNEGLVSVCPYTWTITTQLIILNESLSYGLEEQSYSLDFNCEGGLSPYAYSLESGDLSSLGLALSSGGKITGTLLQDSGGEYQIRIKVEDSNVENLKQTTRKTYTLKIFEALVIEDTNLPDGIEGENYFYSLTVTGGSSPYIYSLIDTNSLGISIDSSGNLSGKINAGKYGNYDVTIEIEDFNGLIDQETFSINIDVGIKIQKTTYANHSTTVTYFNSYDIITETSGGFQYIVQQYSNDSGVDIGIGFGGNDILTASSSYAMALIKINSDGFYNSSIQWGRGQENFWVKKILDTGTSLYIIGHAYSSDLNVDFGLPFGSSAIKILNDANDKIGFIMELDYSLY